MALSVSIIVPVYNCGAMFSPCLQSLREQTLTDFEVILVNNGSTDGSAALAERTAAEDNRFHVIHHPHGGAGECRNVGIAAAQGEYIAFVDGDDRLSPDYLAQLYGAACREQADIAVGGYDYYFLNNNNIKPGQRMPDRVFTQEEALSLLLQDSRIKFYLWGKLFRRTLLTEHNIQIPDMYYEDAVITPQLFYFANRVVSVSRRINDYVNTIPMIRLFLEEQGCFEAYRKKLYNHVFHVYFALPSMIRQSAVENVFSNSGNLRRARAKVRLCLHCSAEKLQSLDLNKPVVE